MMTYEDIKREMENATRSDWYPDIEPYGDIKIRWRDEVSDYIVVHNGNEKIIETLDLVNACHVAAKLAEEQSSRDFNDLYHRTEFDYSQWTWDGCLRVVVVGRIYGVFDYHDNDGFPPDLTVRRYNTIEEAINAFNERVDYWKDCDIID